MRKALVAQFRYFAHFIPSVRSDSALSDEPDLTSDILKINR